MTGISQTTIEEYPQEWPDLPDQFEISNKETIYDDSEFDITLSCAKLEIEISTHFITGEESPDLWTVKLWVDDDKIETQFDNEQKFKSLLSIALNDLPKCRNLHFPQGRNISNKIKGIKDDEIFEVYMSGPTTVNTPLSKVSLTDFTEFSIRDPRDLGTLQFIVQVTFNESENYYYVFDKTCIHIKHPSPAPPVGQAVPHTIAPWNDPNNILMEAFGIPNLSIVFDALEEERGEYTFKYISEECKNRYELIASLI